MKRKVLIAFDTVQEGFEELCEKFDVVRPRPGQNFTQDELDALPHDFDVLAPVFSIPVDRAFIDRYPNLKLIANYAVGYNNIDVAYAQSKGIAVANTPRSVVVPTAEHTLALLLACSRRIAEWDRSMRATRSSRKSLRDSGMGIDLHGKTIGIIGYGNIGRAVARRCHAFGMQILYNKRTPLSACEAQQERELIGAEYASIEEILTRCDVISLHTPYNKDSHHLINAEAFRKMKPNTILLNAARGPVVNETALVNALTEGRLATAGLDVYEHDDNPLDALYSMDNVVMTPHVGTQTYESRVNMARELSNNVIGFFDKDRPVSLVNP